MFEITNHDKIRVIQFANGKVNAMNLEFCRGLSDALVEANADDCGAVVLDGNGRVFSAGVDLKRLINEDAAYMDDFLKALVGVFEKLFLFPKPLVACVNGHAVAGGCVMACAADAKITHNRARIGVPELRVGVPFPSLGLEIMRFAAAPQYFRQMINIGATFSGDLALASGLADEIVEAEKMQERGIEIANELLLVPAEVFTLTKNQLRLPAMQNIRIGEEQFGADINRLWRSEEILDSVRQYVEKTL